MCAQVNFDWKREIWAVGSLNLTLFSVCSLILKLLNIVSFIRAAILGTEEKINISQRMDYKFQS
jgi:hypothetical protein